MTTRDGAEGVEFFAREDAFVPGDLQDAVGAGVENGMAGAEVFGAEFVEHDGATAGEVADEGDAAFALDGVDERIRETLEYGKRLGEDRSGDFPMAGGGVFSHAALAHPSPTRDGRGSGGHTADGSEAECFEGG